MSELTRINGGARWNSTLEYRGPRRMLHQEPGGLRCLGVLCVLLGTFLATATATVADGIRIVAIGDVHGAYEPLSAILRKADLIDGEGQWVGGDSVLVQTGDLLDRGADARQVLDLLMTLQEQAPSAGGRVIALLGNHEVLNLLGEMKDVTPEIVAPFAGRRSETRHERLCREWVALRRERSLRFAGFEFRDRRVERSLCRQENPSGMLEYFAALGPGERYGAWLRGLPAAVQLGELVFLHGGISPEISTLGVAEINRRVREEISLFDRVRADLLARRLILPTTRLREMLQVARAWLDEAVARGDGSGAVRELLDWAGTGGGLLLREDGPFWFRGYARWEEEQGTAAIGPILEALRADRIIVGHTPQRPRSIRSRFGGRAFLIDTGMLASSYRGGRPSALEIQGGRFKAIYVDHDQILGHAEDETAIASRVVTSSAIGSGEELQ